LTAHDSAANELLAFEVRRFSAALDFLHDSSPKIQSGGETPHSKFGLYSKTDLAKKAWFC
jgi:hypothetical protein